MSLSGGGKRGLLFQEKAEGQLKNYLTEILFPLLAQTILERQIDSSLQERSSGMSLLQMMSSCIS